MQPSPANTLGMGTRVGQPPILVPGQVREDFLRADAPLSEKERKYCRCLLKVQATGGTTGSPYGICTKSVGTQVRSCSAAYDWSALDLPLLLAYLELHQISTLGADTREKALASIAQWKQFRGETF